MQDELLTCFARVWPYIGEVLTSDVSVTLTDRDRFIFAKPGKKLDLKISAGDPLKQGSAVVRAMEEKRRVVVRADKSLFGVPYIAVAIPLFGAGNEVIGAASVQETVDRQDALKSMSAALADNVGVVAGTLEEISAQAEEIAATSRAATPPGRWSRSTPSCPRSRTPSPIPPGRSSRRASWPTSSTSWPTA